MIEASIAVVAYIVLIAIIVRCLRANGDDTDAQEAADSVRQALDYEELRTYTRPHVRAGSAWGKEVTK